MRTTRKERVRHWPGMICLSHIFEFKKSLVLKSYKRVALTVFETIYGPVLFNVILHLGIKIEKKKILTREELTILKYKFSFILEI